MINWTSHFVKLPLTNHTYNFRAENVQETQPVNLMNEWNAILNAVKSVHNLLGNLYRECDKKPAVMPSVNQHLLCMRNKEPAAVVNDTQTYKTLRNTKAMIPPPEWELMYYVPGST